MNRPDFLTQPGLFIEIGAESWQVCSGNETVAIPVERLEADLKKFVNKGGWRPRRVAWVAIGARGVSLRRLVLPPAGKDEFQRLLRLQIESEFPLPPDELAWGWQALGRNPARQEVLVAAVKKEVLEPCSQILAACGITPIFTVAALARTILCPPPLPSCVILNVGAKESELLIFQDGAPASIRLLSWGSERKEPFDPKFAGGNIYLTGPGARQAGNYPVLEGGNTIAGLKKLAALGGLPLVLQSGEARAATATVSTWKWAVAAACLLAAYLGFPYAEAMVFKPHLVKKLAAIEADRARLPAIDQELEFLENLKRAQPPYLDTIYLVAKYAPPQTSFESLTMTRKGEFSVRGKLQNAQQVADFRSNLIQSAWFSSVVVEEQTPSPDRKVTVRMTAQVKPVDSRKPLVVETNSPAEKK